MYFFLKYDGITLLGTNTSEKLTLLHGKEIILITGIANQKPIIDLLNKNNCQITNLCYQDHHSYSSQDVKDYRHPPLAKRCFTFDHRKGCSKAHRI